MTKLLVSLCCACLIFTGCGNSQPPWKSAERDSTLISIDSMGASLNWPADLEITGFAGPGLTPSPACLAVAPTGEVFVGVDMIGSLGKDRKSTRLNSSH